VLAAVAVGLAGLIGFAGISCSLNDRSGYSLYQLVEPEPGTYVLHYDIPREHQLVEVVTARSGGPGGLIMTVLASIGVLMGGIAGAMLVLLLPPRRERAVA
jgi:hypothetical protein